LHKRGVESDEASKKSGNALLLSRCRSDGRIYFSVPVIFYGGGWLFDAILKSLALSFSKYV